MGNEIFYGDGLRDSFSFQKWNRVSIVTTGFVALNLKWGKQVLKGLTGWKLTLAN